MLCVSEVEDKGVQNLTALLSHREEEPVVLQRVTAPVCSAVMEELGSMTTST